MEIVNPHLRNVASQRRICPECAKAFLRVEPARNPDTARDVCDRCGHWEPLMAPTGFCVPYEERPPAADEQEASYDALVRGLAEARGDPPAGELLEFRPRT